MQPEKTFFRYRLQYPALAEYLPPVPQSIEETGLPFALINDLVLRRLFATGLISGMDLARDIHLPYNGVVGVVLERLVRDKQVEFTGGPGFGRPYFDYLLTEKGRDRARDAYERCSYVGPAPIPLATYTAMVRRQLREVPHIGRGELDAAFHDLVMEDAFCERLGPAVNSVRSLFLYGAPGNGKTSIAERIAGILRGEIFVPYALEVDSQIIQVFDPLVHRPILPLTDAEAAAFNRRAQQLREVESRLEDTEDGETVEVQLPTLNGIQIDSEQGDRVLELEPWDARWVLTSRPRIVVGGELTLEMLDLVFNPASNFYEAPYQVKSCAGMLLIDDFGRQKVDPTDLLNRWIVPLEKRIDFLTLRTGKKFEVPFDLLVIFSTNLDPSRLVDEAFLRRIRYKIEVPDPTERVFRDIFVREANRQGVRFDPSVMEYVLETYYRGSGRKLRGCHPRDILQLIVDHARFLRCDPVMSRKLVDHACQSYFVHMEGDGQTLARGVTGPGSVGSRPAEASGARDARDAITPMDLDAFLNL